jgi:hypothetical protein
MTTIRDMPLGDLLELRTAIRDAIEAMAWFDLQAEPAGLRQCGAEWSAAAEALRKVDAEQKRRAKIKTA